MAHDLATNAEPTADKLSEAVISAAQQAADQAQPNADKAERIVRDNAHLAATEGPARAEEVLACLPGCCWSCACCCLQSTSCGNFLAGSSSAVQVLGRFTELVHDATGQ